MNDEAHTNVDGDHAKVIGRHQPLELSNLGFKVL